MPCRTRAEEHARRRARSAILRDLLGWKCLMRFTVAQSPRRFAEELRKHGHDPARYGDLGVSRPGGPPRRDDAAALLRQKRYRYLRDCGYSSAEATRNAGSPSTFAREVRRMRLTRTDLPPLPPEITARIE